MLRQKFKLNTFLRLRMVLLDELVDNENRVLFTNDDFNKVLRHSKTNSELRDKILKSFLVIIFINLIFSRSIDFSYNDVNLAQLGGPELTSFLALLLTFNLYMIIMTFQNEQYYRIAISIMHQLLTIDKKIDEPITSFGFMKHMQ